MMLYESKHPLKATITYTDSFKTYFEEHSGFHKIEVDPDERLVTFKFFKHIEDEEPMNFFVVKALNFVSFSLESVIIKNS